MFLTTAQYLGSEKGGLYAMHFFFIVDKNILVSKYFFYVLLLSVLACFIEHKYNPLSVSLGTTQIHVDMLKYDSHLRQLAMQQPVRDCLYEDRRKHGWPIQSIIYLRGLLMGTLGLCLADQCITFGSSVYFSLAFFWNPSIQVVL